MMVFWQPGYTKCSVWYHSARLCWRKDPCTLNTPCQPCWCSRGRKLKYKIYWAWSGWCLWHSPEPHHGGRAQQICNWILLVITRLIACVNRQIQGNLVNNFSWAERRYIWVGKQLQVLSLRLRPWVGKAWMLPDSTSCPGLYPSGRSTPEFHTFSPQLGYILLSINSKPLMILGIT